MFAQHLTQTPHPPADHGRPLHVRSASRPDRLKRGFDLAVAVVIAVVAAPVIAAAWVLVRATSSGPGFYSQLRVGRNGRLYRIYKIRTMYHNCEAASGAAWCTRHDRRVTRVGRVLRKLHVDELPQLLNVLRGDMSLVGPRPERPEFVGPLASQIPGYADRLAVRPGVTGLAQIQLPADLEVDDVRRKLVLDRCYAERRDLWLDVRILVGTLVYLCGFSYGTVRRVVLLPNPLAEEQSAGRAAGVVVGPFGIKRTVAQVDGSLATGSAPIPFGEPQ
jgi:lipopolysaccharide/colanic/teichoic acid biosynthesis glycosyltransferase